MRFPTLSALVIACVFMLPRPASGQDLDHPEAFYPLQTGNLWQYSWRGGGVQWPDSVVVTVEVVGDTLMPNGHTYQHLTVTPDSTFAQVPQPHWPDAVAAASEFQRIDTARATVYSYDPESGQESAALWLAVMPDSLANPDSTADPYVFRFDSLAHRVVLGQEQRVLRGIEAGDEIHPDREILVAEGIGTVKHDTFHGAQSQLSRHTRLLYARVEGREYGERVATSVAPSEEVPAAIALGANLPNPFRTATRIPFEVRHAGHVQVVIYDLTGRAVAVLVDGHVSPGRHEAVWAPDGLASGVYVGALITDAARQTRLLLYVK